jgi:hypothetical protein
VYILLTEDRTDFDAVKIIIRRLAGNDSLPICGKGFNGAGEIKNKGTATINALWEPEFKACIVVRDCDGTDSAGRLASVKQDVFDSIKIKEKPVLCVVLPKHELEAWYLADIQCVTQIWPQWHPEREYPNPETIVDPKKELERLSRTKNLKPRYSTNDGAAIANKLNLEIVRKKCASFHPLYNLVTEGKGNV